MPNVPSLFVDSSRHPTSSSPCTQTAPIREHLPSQIDLRDLNSKRKFTIKPPARVPVAPPVPPKDSPSETGPRLPAFPQTRRLNMPTMLDDCILSTPTPEREGGIAQAYREESIEKDRRSDNGINMVSLSQEIDNVRQMFTTTNEEEPSLKRQDSLINPPKTQDHTHTQKSQTATNDTPTTTATTRLIPANKPTRGAIPLKSKFTPSLPSHPPLTKSYTNPRAAPTPPSPPPHPSPTDAQLPDLTHARQQIEARTRVLTFQSDETWQDKKRTTSHFSSACRAVLSKATKSILTMRLGPEAAARRKDRARLKREIKRLEEGGSWDEGRWRL